MFTEDATWLGYSYDENPSIVYADGTVKEVAVSKALLGNDDNNYALSIDLTDICKEMLQEKKYILYLNFKNSCPTAMNYCENSLIFYGHSHSDSNLKSKMTWEFECKLFLIIL